MAKSYWTSGWMGGTLWWLAQKRVHMSVDAARKCSGARSALRKRGALRGSNQLAVAVKLIVFATAPEEEAAGTKRLRTYGTDVA
jgi:hypothetical protein